MHFLELDRAAGSLQFSHTDISLPGNSPLPVQFTRTYATGVSDIASTFSRKSLLGDWDVDLPHMSGVFPADRGWVNAANSTARCTNYSAPPTILITSAPPPPDGVGASAAHATSPGMSVGQSNVKSGLAGAAVEIVNNYFYATDYWQGNFLQVPGHGSQEVLKRASANTSAPTDGYTYPLVTRDHWQLRCLSALRNGSGEGFVARSPDGTQYRFDWLTYRTERFLKGAGTVGLARSEARLYATLVTDRFGNTVTYQYDTSGRPLSILASDGRKITFTYSTINGAQRISTAFDGTRTWAYDYSAAGDLETVTQPDGAQWKFNLRGLVYPRPYELGEEANVCGNYGGWPSTSQTGTITHPSGAVGTFETRYVYHARSNVTKYCINKTGRPLDPTFARWPHQTVSQTLIRKTISGPGVTAPLTWQFDYSTGVGSWGPCNPCNGGDAKTVTVTDPRGIDTVHTYGIRFKETEGQLLSVQEGWNGTSALRQTDYRYRKPAGQPYPEPPGTSISETTDFLATVHRPQDQKVIGVQGTSFYWTANTFDSRARPVSVTRNSTLGFSRTDTTAYFDSASKWTLGQIASITEGSTGSVTERYTFDPLTLRQANVYQHGRYAHTNAFYTDGTLKSRTDPEGKATTFSSYMRGIPRLVQYHDGTSESAVVSNQGLITSYTNEAGSTTGYGYDTMGRLSRITPPAGDPGGAYDTTRSFVPVSTAEFGLPAGHWRQTITTGNAVTSNYFDAFWQPLLTKTYDSANEAGTRRMIQRRFDPDGRQTFESYPLRTIAAVDSAMSGRTTNHDAIGRVRTEVQSTELGDKTTTTNYLANFQRQVIDARNIGTVQGFQAFDTPSDEAPTLINRAGVSVAINRNVFGAPVSITRSGTYDGVPQSISRWYVYDDYQRLCKTREGESGSTLQAYDTANNMAWRANGLNLPSTTSCDTASAPANRKLVFDYDARNRLASTTYGDGSPGITRTYTLDGLPRTIAIGGWKPSTWTLTYNKRRLLTEESLALDRGNYDFTWGVNAYGKVSSLTYPDGLLVNYTPNALGEPTQLATFASAITYHPNGAVASYTLGNGITVSQTLNTRQLPLKVTHTGTAQEQYTYDANANVTAIDDQWLNTSDRTMGYDNLDRLTSATGPWGASSFTYDAIDNLRTSTVGSRSTIGSYVSNRLQTLTTNGVAVRNEYDANGNLTARGAQGFAFDIGNRMSSATGKATYAYDALGRRTWLAYAGGTAKQQIYSQAGQLLYSARSGQAAVRNVYLGDKLVAESNASTGTVFTHTDALGSVIARTNVSGAVLSRTTFEPYGAAATGTAPTGVGFTGHVHDADTELVYMQQRYYDPMAGRFLSVDPVTTDAKSGDGFNRYAYGNNNPYKFKDPNGKFAIVALLPAFVDAVVAAVATNTGAAVVGVAGGVAIGAVVSSSASQNGNNSAAAAPAAAEGAPAASGTEGPSRSKESGSYTNTHESGKTYDGKGSRERSQESGRRVEGETGDKHTATDWTPAKDSREGFQQESKRLDSNGGPKSDANYNKIESPGKKMREQDAN